MISTAPICSSIRALPPDLVAKIAAGEVVERPASVVKELVENALDAAATSVRVEIQRGGFGLIRITDNGDGVPADQMELAVARHATSKLSAFDDLYRVRTLGFRGEALASIAAVSHLEIVSRARGQAAGHALRVEGGQVVRQGPSGSPHGTSVSVRQLFYNVPARQAFQRAPSGETRQIVQLCGQLALAAPQVRFLVEVDGRVALKGAGGDLRDAVAAAFGAEAAAHMIELPRVEQDGIFVWGYCSGPEEHRNTRLYCTFCVNGRLVRSQALTYAVEEAYHALLPIGRHPLAAIHVSVPPEDVDVNVHPTKAEVRLRRERLVFMLLRDATRRALAAFAPVPSLQPSAIGAFSSGGTQPRVDFPPEADPTWPATPSVPSAADGEDPPAQPELIAAPPAPPPAAPEAASALRGGRLRALGQVGLTYIVAEDGSGMYLIDQHSAHERIVYEQLLRAAKGSDAGPHPAPAAQLLLTPDAVELTATQSAWLEANADALRDFGFQAEPFGGHAWLVRAVPRTLASKGRGKALGELIDGLIEHEYGDGPIHDQARWAVACHSAVRAGDALAPVEMAALIEELERCDMRRTCPHGRPTMIHLSHAQLEREFGRR